MDFPFEDTVEPSSIGMKASVLYRVVERFKRQQARGAFPGGQLVVRRKGKSVINEAIGIARGYRPDESAPALETRPGTLFPVYSCGKPLAAVAVAMLEDKGLLDINAPIAGIFPEFANHGKGEISTLDVLTHRSGILLPHLTAEFEVWRDRKEMQKQLSDAIPVYKRGTLAYQPGEFGWILSEVVSRTDGRNIADYIEEEITTPLDLPDLKFGLQDNAYGSIACSYWQGKNRVMVAGINVAENYESYANDPRFFNSRNPSFTLIANAASLAAFYEFLVNGGLAHNGARLVAEELVKKYTTRRLFGWDRSLKTFLSLGQGFMTGTLTPSLYGWWNTGRCFGHAGVFSCLAFGDHGTGLPVAIITNGNRDMGDFFKRFVPIAHGCRSACL